MCRVGATAHRRMIAPVPRSRRSARVLRAGHNLVLLVRGCADQELPMTVRVQLSQHMDRNCPGGNIMKRALTAVALAGTVAIATIATPTSAHAQWRRGWGWGLGGLALGLIIGGARSRPAY